MSDADEVSVAEADGFPDAVPQASSGHALCDAPTEATDAQHSDLIAPADVSMGDVPSTKSSTRARLSDLTNGWSDESVAHDRAGLPVV